MECFAMQAMLYLKWPILDQASVYRASGEQISVCRRYLQNQDGLQVLEVTEKLLPPDDVKVFKLIQNLGLILVIRRK